MIATPEFVNADETKWGPCFVLPAAGFLSSLISISMVERENCLSDFLDNSIRQYCIGTITIITCAPEWNRRQSLWPTEIELLLLAYGSSMRVVHGTRTTRKIKPL